MEVWSFVATSVEEGTVAVGRMRVEGDTGGKTMEISSGEKKWVQRIRDFGSY